MFNELKLRAAYGESGNEPLYGQKFTPLTATGNIGSIPGLTVGATTGAATLKPERQREIELGTDGQLWGSRLSFEATVYQKTISDCSYPTLARLPGRHEISTAQAPHPRRRARVGSCRCRAVDQLVHPDQLLTNRARSPSCRAPLRDGGFGTRLARSGSSGQVGHPDRGSIPCRTPPAPSACRSRHRRRHRLPDVVHQRHHWKN